MILKNLVRIYREIRVSYSYDLCVQRLKFSLEYEHSLNREEVILRHKKFRFETTYLYKKSIWNSNFTASCFSSESGYIEILNRYSSNKTEINFIIENNKLFHKIKELLLAKESEKASDLLKFELEKTFNNFKVRSDLFFRN